MKLPVPVPSYGPDWQARQNVLIERADEENVKKNRDNYMGDGRVILTAPDGGLWAITVDEYGELSTVNVTTGEAAVHKYDPIYDAQTLGIVNGKTANQIYVLGRRDNGWNSTTTFGDVCQYLDTSQDLMNTPTTGQTLYVVSTSANDTSAGTGVRTVKITYLDASGLQQTTTATMNGTTAVAIGTGYSFIQWAESVTVGSLGVAAGNISVTSTNGAATVATTFEFIKSGGNRSMSGRFKVPSDCTGYVHSAYYSAISTTMDFRLRADVDATTRAVTPGVFHFQDTAYLSSGQSLDKAEDWLKMPAGAVIKISAVPGSAPAGNRADANFDILCIAD
jgi:hypothetical protein